MAGVSDPVRLAILIHLNDSQLSAFTIINREFWYQRLLLYEPYFYLQYQDIFEWAQYYKARQTIQQWSSDPDIFRYSQLFLFHKKIRSVPAQISLCAHLTLLHLGHNDLLQIPKEIAQLQQLRHLYLNDNKLQSLPAQLAELHNLTGVYVSHNALSSLFDLRNLLKLQELFANNNYLTEIAPELRDLPELQTVAYYNNAIDQQDPMIAVLRARRPAVMLLLG